MAEITKDFLEFFSGIGLVAEGLAPGGWRCVFANDCDERKNLIYKDRLGDDGTLCPHDVNDTEKILASLPKRAFLATASFPCVDLSLAGKQKGLSGPHTSAFHGFVEVLRRLGKKKPKVVLAENVPGLVSSRGGRDFRIVTRELAGLGYYLDAFVLNASHFVPQNRLRIFIVGVSKELIPSKVIRGSGLLPHRPAELTTPRLDKMIRETPLETGWIRFPLPPPPSMKQTLLDIIDLDEGAKWWPDARVNGVFSKIPDNHRAVLREKLVSRTTWAGTIRTNHRNGQTSADLRLDGFAGAILTPRAAGGRQILVVTMDGRLKMRWLTAKEYARLQGSSVPPTLTELLDTSDSAAWWSDRKTDETYATMAPSHRMTIRKWLLAGEDRLATLRNRTRRGKVQAELRSDDLAGCLLPPKGAGARQILLHIKAGRMRMRWLDAEDHRRLQGSAR